MLVSLQYSGEVLQTGAVGSVQLHKEEQTANEIESDDADKIQSVDYEVC